VNDDCGFLIFEVTRGRILFLPIKNQQPVRRSLGEVGSSLNNRQFFPLVVIPGSVQKSAVRIETDLKGFMAFYSESFAKFARFAVPQLFNPVPSCSPHSPDASEPPGGDLFVLASLTPCQFGLRHPMIAVTTAAALPSLHSCHASLAFGIQ
jgi:hypothetical protein